MDVHTFDFDYNVRKNWTFGLFSDIHIDAIGHDAKLFIEDMDACAAENGRAFFNGDLIDAIYPTDKKRYSRAGDALTTDAQVNETIELAVNRLKSYVDIIDYFGYGNHETSALKYNNVDVLRIIVDNLNQYRSKSLKPIVRGGYVGFIHLRFRRGDGGTKRYVIWRDHGKGGNSPVTKGIIGLNRSAVAFGCDLIWHGHSHNDITDRGGWNITVGADGKLNYRRRIATITPGYNRNFSETRTNDGNYARNFPEESFYAPTGLGCQFLKLDLTRDDIRAKIV